MRAFFALPLPPELCEVLAARSRAVPGLRAQQPGTIHLTLRFLGEIEEAGPLAEAVGPAARAFRPFDLELIGLGVFPHPGAARVLWAGVGGGAGEAIALAAAVEAALEPLGFPREARAFRPHVTLGRFPRPRRVPAPFLAVGPALGTARADRLILYRSTLTPQGALHHPAAVLSLGDGM
ncbi:MAG: RNA 2',3'-cyclic phosphodiesterase [Planctomycetaceae bacterium]